VTGTLAQPVPPSEPATLATGFAIVKSVLPDFLISPPEEAEK
jgi:hypothetical protein